jgi:hypothetical protein
MKFSFTDQPSKDVVYYRKLGEPFPMICRVIFKLLPLLLLISTSCNIVPNQSYILDEKEGTVNQKITPMFTPESTNTPTPMPSFTPTAIPQPPMLQVEGTRFVDEFGNSVILRGVAIMDPILLASGQNPNLGSWSEDIFRVLDEWGADIVRLPIHPPMFFDYGIERSLRVLDRAIEWAAKYDLYVIIDYHGLGFPPDGYSKYEWAATTEEEMIHFWELVSERYAGNNVVGFYQYYNEPMRDNSRRLLIEDWMIWKEFSEDMIDVIREYDPETIIIVSAMKGGNDLSFALNAPIERPNIAYEAHPFPGQSRWCPWEKCFGKVSEVYPVIVEYGFDNATWVDEFLQETSFVGSGRYRDALMEYVEERELSWTTWVFSHDWTPRLLLDTEFTPSEFGQFVKEQLMIHATE